MMRFFKRQKQQQDKPDERNNNNKVATGFQTLGLSKDLLRAIEKAGYKSPTPIQQKAIPLVIDGGDVLAAAQTGTGKTAAFTLPMLERLSSPNQGRAIRALILTPTRELAAQVLDSIATYSQHLKLRSFAVFGGVNINPQKKKISQGVDILVATPGRLLDLVQQRVVDLSHIEMLVLDEADRMLDMGFIHDMKKIIGYLPKKRQTLLFSATFSKEIRSLAQQFLHRPTEVSVTPKNTAAKTVQQVVYSIDRKQKSEALLHLISNENWFQVLVFHRTKHGANKLTKFLMKNGVNATAIHGNKSQNARTTALADFKSGKVQVLVATDIASRGLDISELPQVVNFELPDVPEDYVHRIGRTGRAGADGHALSLVSKDESKQLKQIERLMNTSIRRATLSGFTGSSTKNDDSPKKKSSNWKRRRPRNKQKSAQTQRKDS